MVLELRDLTHEERVALVALMERAVRADGYASDAEAKQVNATARALGRASYEAAAEEADRRFANDAELWRFLPSIQRQEARELIYETVLEAALADAPVRAETELLKRLSDVWHLSVRIVDAPK